MGAQLARRDRRGARPSRLARPAAHVGTTLPSAPTGRPSSRRRCSPLILMFMIMAVATDPARSVGCAAIAIGGTVGLDALFGGPITGASMNPARSIGPASSPADFTSIWIYMAAPMSGRRRGRRLPVAPCRVPTRRGVEKADEPVLFVCIHNAGRSQISPGTVRAGRGAAHDARSAGTAPARPGPSRGDRGDGELGIDLAGRVPHLLDRATRVGRRRGDDGLWRRMPLHPREALPRLGARRPRRPAGRGRPGCQRRDRAPGGRPPAEPPVS